VKNANAVLHDLVMATRRHAEPRFRRMRARISRGVAMAVVVAVPSLGLVACAKEKAAAASMAGATSGTGAPKTVADFFPIKVGNKIVRMQLAVRPAEMQRGLMERRDLARDDGMIFIYEKPQQMGFWMRNTPTPLDIGFFSTSGVLEEIYPLHPFDETTVASRSDHLQFALEMNQGWFRENAVKPGAQLDLKALADALKARGFEPRKFGVSE
jgi:uncharacterized protein